MTHSPPSFNPYSFNNRNLATHSTLHLPSKPPSNETHPDLMSSVSTKILVKYIQNRKPPEIKPKSGQTTKKSKTKAKRTRIAYLQSRGSLRNRGSDEFERE
ncbi:hypothetical protein V6N12_017509 [Hibiscus sabdariffa]|uniref:DET1- and DDB1-associated protein 1 n=1 Tax=Hibiscus sabdariffa TaxID=183260 RepID=A0ABR2CFP8_9ROSI